MGGLAKHACSSDRYSTRWADPVRKNLSVCNHVLAVFSARLPIELGLLSIAGTGLALHGISCHLRVLTGVLPHGIVNTSAPSEPILAVAATHTLTRSGLAGSSSMYKAAVSTLVKKLILQVCLAERGTQGGLLAHLILAVTRDCALPPDVAGLPVVYHHGTVAARPVIETTNLGEFLTALLGNTLMAASIRGGDYPGSTSAGSFMKWARRCPPSSYGSAGAEGSA